MDIQIKDAELLRLQKGDVLCINLPEKYRHDVLDHIRASVYKALERVGLTEDDVAVMVLDAGINVTVVRPEDIPICGGGN